MQHDAARDPMPQEAAGRRRSAFILNTDGERHPLENTLAFAAIGVGVTALVLGIVPSTHFFGLLAGVIGLPLALYSQLVSATTGERWLNVIGMVTAFVGAAFALDNGGFSV